ncbi:hypothetical protein NCCP1664_09580 [Zafaria cholistanensis]|uniref:HTH arsR-type domain-containing protein n=1 Tax=Zafaria cholistanensis TaxID=1682741 RepID=A0A5A7NRL7_9MICC|nr:metalloregulator ArsR/SmtB family transcription factor [Zafaria cholistanensis]GER22461.1 hypothetical protein NCCP1664_09580 [Zafaria cholistanensis]
MAHDDVFTVISDGTRRQLLDALREGDRSVGELVEALGVSQPTVSKHLKVLREAGLATMRAEGQRRYYSVSPEPLNHAARWLAAFTPAGRAPSPAGAGTPAAAAAGTAPAADAGTASAPAPAAAQPASLANPQPIPQAPATAAPVAPAHATQAAQQLGRTVGRTVEQVTGRAADLLERLQKPKFGRRR